MLSSMKSKSWASWNKTSYIAVSSNTARTVATFPRHQDLAPGVSSGTFTMSPTLNFRAMRRSPLVDGTFTACCLAASPFTLTSPQGEGTRDLVLPGSSSLEKVCEVLEEEHALVEIDLPAGDFPAVFG